MLDMFGLFGGLPLDFHVDFGTVSVLDDQRIGDDIEVWGWIFVLRGSIW